MSRITEDMRKMFGFAHAIHIIAIIEIVLYCCFIVGLVLLAFPIAGKRIANSWNDSDISCVILTHFPSCLVRVLETLPLRSWLPYGSWEHLLWCLEYCCELRCDLLDFLLDLLARPQREGAEGERERS